MENMCMTFEEACAILDSAMACAYSGCTRTDCSEDCPNYTEPDEVARAQYIVENTNM